MGTNCCSQGKDKANTDILDRLVNPNEAAIAIQVAFRGWKVRKSVKMQLYFRFNPDFDGILNFFELERLRADLTSKYNSLFLIEPEKGKYTLEIETRTQFIEVFGDKMLEFLENKFSFTYRNRIEIKNDKLLHLFDYLPKETINSTGTQLTACEEGERLSLVGADGEFDFITIITALNSTRYSVIQTEEYLFKGNSENGIGLEVDGNKAYFGYFMGKKYHGIGILVENGNIYRGEFRNGKKNGFGWEYKEKENYAGFHFSGLREGFGETEGNLNHIGCYSSDKFTSIGLLVLPSEGKYCGDFVQGRMEGEGLFKWDKGFSYEGHWLEGRMEGEGIYKYKNKDWYRGAFKNNEKHGKGEYFSSKTVKTSKGRWNMGKRLK